jgi:purine-binding chemotaxis protein CheW
MFETILEIKLGDEFFGIDSDKANQILRVPPITPIPLSASFLKGVAVLNGRVVSIMDLKEILGIGEVDINNEKSRLITITIDNEEVGVLVDEVIDAIEFTDENYEENTSDDKLCIGFYRDDENLIQIIKPQSIITRELILTFKPLEVEKLKDENDINTLVDNESKRFLFFKSNNEFYAVDIEVVSELIFVPNTITYIPGSSSADLGAITLRDEVINVFDFNVLFGFGKQKITQKSRLLILKNKNKKIALLVEEVDEIKDISLSDLEKLQMNDEKIESLYKGEEHIVSIISNMFLKNLIDEQSITENDEVINEGRSEDMRELCVFRIEKEEFAFDIEKVQEIIAYQEITPLPQSGEYIEGIINLRGSVIVVVNLPKKLSFKLNISDKTKIVVCSIEDEKVGFLVDEVNDIMFIEDRYVSVSKNANSLVKSTISLDDGKRVILELKVEKLVDIEEIKSIDKE